MSGDASAATRRGAFFVLGRSCSTLDGAWPRTITCHQSRRL